jgi:hypothetical protein
MSRFVRWISFGVGLLFLGALIYGMSGRVASLSFWFGANEGTVAVSGAQLIFAPGAYRYEADSRLTCSPEVTVHSSTAHFEFLSSRSHYRLRVAAEELFLVSDVSSPYLLGIPLFPFVLIYGGVFWSLKPHKRKLQTMTFERKATV